MSEGDYTLISGDGKVQYHSPWIPSGLEPEQWYTSEELEELGMIFLRDFQPRKRNKWRFTTYSKAQMESGSWREIPDWYQS